MLTNPAPIVLGLASALTWGGADFAGGLATRHAAPGRVIFVAHGISLVALCLLLALHANGPTAHTMTRPMLLLALASGISGGLGLMLFYKALSIGAMGLSAALAGLLTAALPVALAMVEQGRPGAWQQAGFGVAAVAIALIAWSPGEPTHLRTLGMATLAGVGFGVQLVVLHVASAQGAVLPALALSRLGGTATGGAAMLLAFFSARRKQAPGAEAFGPTDAALQGPSGIAACVPHLADPSNLGAKARMLPYAPEPRTPAVARTAFLLLAATTGLLDTAGNGLYMAAALVGRLDIAAVLASLYPGATILLAAWLLKERTSLLQTLGMALALIAVALISA